VENQQRLEKKGKIGKKRPWVVYAKYQKMLITGGLSHNEGRKGWEKGRGNNGSRLPHYRERSRASVRHQRKVKDPGRKSTREKHNNLEGPKIKKTTGGGTWFREDWSAWTEIPVWR